MFLMFNSSFKEILLPNLDNCLLLNFNVMSSLYITIKIWDMPLAWGPYWPKTDPPFVPTTVAAWPLEP